MSSVDGTILGEWTPTVAADVQDMTWDGQYLYGVDFIDDKIYKFDPITLDIVDSIPAPSGIAQGLTWDGTYFWVTEKDTNWLYKIDSVGNVIQTYGGYGALSLSGLAWDGENLWLGLPFEDCILKIAPDTGEVLETLSGGDYWRVKHGCTFDGQYLWCNWYDQLIAQIDIGERDTTAPIITNVTITNIADESVTIKWDTDEVADSLVKYGKASGIYIERKKNYLFIKKHSIELTGLLQDTCYYFIINSTDQSGNSAESLEYNFTTSGALKVFDTGTPANPYPSIFGTHTGTIKADQTITV